MRARPTAHVSDTWVLGPSPYGSKVSNYMVFKVSILRIVIMVLARYRIVGFWDPLGSCDRRGVYELWPALPASDVPVASGGTDFECKGYVI